MSSPRIRISGRARLLFVAGVVVAVAALVLKLADSVRESDIVTRADQHTMDFVVRHRVGWISHVARIVTFFGNGWVVAAVVVAALAFLLLRRRFPDALFIGLSAAGTAILVAVAKHLIDRPRPVASVRLVTATGAAFPSGHAAQSVACYCALAFVVVHATRSKRTRFLVVAAAALVAFSIGASRVYLGVHWPSDVVSGWMIAGGWLLALAGARRALEPENEDES